MEKATADEIQNWQTAFTFARSELLAEADAFHDQAQAQSAAQALAASQAGVLPETRLNMRLITAVGENLPRHTDTRIEAPHQFQVSCFAVDSLAEAARLRSAVVRFPRQINIDAIYKGRSDSYGDKVNFPHYIIGYRPDADFRDGQTGEVLLWRADGRANVIMDEKFQTQNLMRFKVNHYAFMGLEAAMRDNLHQPVTDYDQHGDGRIYGSFATEVEPDDKPESLFQWGFRGNPESHDDLIAYYTKYGCKFAIPGGLRSNFRFPCERGPTNDEVDQFHITERLAHLAVTLGVTAAVDARIKQVMDVYAKHPDI